MLASFFFIWNFDCGEGNEIRPISMEVLLKFIRY